MSYNYDTWYWKCVEFMPPVLIAFAVLSLVVAIDSSYVMERFESAQEAGYTVIVDGEVVDGTEIMRRYFIIHKALFNDKDREVTLIERPCIPYMRGLIKLAGVIGVVVLSMHKLHVRDTIEIRKAFRNGYKAEINRQEVPGFKLPLLWFLRYKYMISTGTQSVMFITRDQW